MNVEQFVIECKKWKDVEVFIKKHLNQKYINYEVKVDICEKIVHLCNFDEEMKFERNTPMTQMMFSMELIKNYYDIDIEYEDMLDDFNKLDKEGLVRILIDNIPEDEYKKFMFLLDAINDDIQVNERSLVGYMERQLKAMTHIGE